MRAICLSEPRQMTMIDVAEPASPGPDEALVRVHRTGVCGSDLHAYNGRQMFMSYPRVLGHELGVEVLATGSNVSNVQPGDLCAIEPFLSCGQCVACRAGKTNCCAAIKVLGIHTDGGMTERINVPAVKLHPSRTLPADLLAVVEPLCIGAHAWARADLASARDVLIAGAGPIGLAVAASALCDRVRPVFLETSPYRLEFVRQRLGLQAINVDADAMENVRRRFGGDLAEVIFDCTGSPRAMNMSFEYVRHGGKVVFVGHHPGDLTFANPLFHGREITLYASRNATAGDFRRVLDHLETGRMDVSSWFTGTTAPEDVPLQFPSWMDPEKGVIKPIIAWS